MTMSLFQLVEFSQDSELVPPEGSAGGAGSGGGCLKINDVRKIFAAAVAPVDVGAVRAADEQADTALLCAPLIY